MKILIVDDELVSRKSLQKLMESIGECENVEKGIDALKMAASDNPPDLILLDILMPAMDGFEVCNWMKADPKTKDIPIIFLSANNRIEDITKGFECGAVDYITKPFHPSEVKARVRTHLALKKMREDLSAKNVLLEKQVQEIQEKTDELRQKDIQLIAMDRIAGIGALAAGIAHEINNPLSFVKSSLDMLHKSLLKMNGALRFWLEKPVTESLMNEFKVYLSKINYDYLIDSMDSKYDRAKRGIDRIMKIVNSLRSFSRVDRESTGQLDINQSLADAMDIMSADSNKNVEYIKELQSIPAIQCATSEINQCLLHIINNALDAIENNGTIKVSTSYSEEEERICIRITDDGKGMSPEVMRQACNPFFTTKEVGSGTGLGLTMTERILTRHGGLLQLSSIEGKGTTVTMFIPVLGECVKTDQKSL